MPDIDSHAVTVLNQKMYLYGGYIASNAQLMNDIYALDLKTMKWEKVYSSKGSSNEPEGRSNLAMVGH